jgi:hypothetical protein
MKKYQRIVWRINGAIISVMAAKTASALNENKLRCGVIWRKRIDVAQL